MQFRVAFKKENGAIKVEIICVYEGNYPTSDIFNNPEVDCKSAVNIYPRLEVPTCSNIISEKRFTSSVDAIMWLQEIKREIQEQYDHWKAKQIPTDYCFEIV